MRDKKIATTLKFKNNKAPITTDATPSEAPVETTSEGTSSDSTAVPSDTSSIRFNFADL